MKQIFIFHFCISRKKTKIEKQLSIFIFHFLNWKKKKRKLNSDYHFSFFNFQKKWMTLTYMHFIPLFLFGTLHSLFVFSVSLLAQTAWGCASNSSGFLCSLHRQNSGKWPKTLKLVQWRQNNLSKSVKINKLLR